MPRKTLKTIWNEIVHGKRHILPARFHFRNRKRTNRQHSPPFRVLFILLNNDSSGSKTKQIFKFHLDSIAYGIQHIKAGERRNCPRYCQQQPKSGYKQTNGPSSCLFPLSPSCLPASQPACLMLQHTHIMALYRVPNQPVSDPDQEKKMHIQKKKHDILKGQYRKGRRKQKKKNNTDMAPVHNWQTIWQRELNFESSLSNQFLVNWMNSAKRAKINSFKDVMQRFSFMKNPG